MAASTDTAADDAAWLQLRPMKAVTGPLPPDDGRWATELKWDGMRLLVRVQTDGSIALRTTNGLDATARFPELAPLGAALAGTPAILDGEAVALDDEGIPSFGRLQHRMHLTGAAEIRRRAADVPVALMVFDLLRCGGNDVMPLPYLDRRRLLRELLDDGESWRVPSHRIGEAAALLAAASEHRMEGIVAKRIDSPYVPGRRSPAWVKVKARREQEFVVGGWLPGEGGRSGRIGALLLGYHEGGALRYAGRVGTGFTDAELDRLGAVLAPLAVEQPAFAGTAPAPVRRVARWVRPEVVVQVSFGEWTSEGILRHPVYLGQRIDKPAADVVREG